MTPSLLDGSFQGWTVSIKSGETTSGKTEARHAVGIRMTGRALNLRPISRVLEKSYRNPSGYSPVRITFCGGSRASVQSHQPLR